MTSIKINGAKKEQLICRERWMMTGYNCDVYKELPSGKLTTTFQERTVDQVSLPPGHGWHSVLAPATYMLPGEDDPPSNYECDVKKVDMNGRMDAVLECRVA